MSVTYSGPISWLNVRRSQVANAGEWPPVANVTRRGPWRTLAGRVKAQLAGSSALFTPHPGDLAVEEHLAVDGGVVGGGDAEAIVGHLTRPVGPRVTDDTRQSGGLCGDPGGDDVDLGVTGQELGDLPHGYPTAADHQAAAPGDDQVHRVQRRLDRHQLSVDPTRLVAAAGSTEPARRV